MYRNKLTMIGSSSECSLL